MAQDKILRQAQKQAEQSIALMRLMVRHRYKIWAVWAIGIGGCLWMLLACLFQFAGLIRQVTLPALKLV